MNRFIIKNFIFIAAIICLVLTLTSDGVTGQKSRRFKKRSAVPSSIAKFTSGYLEGISNNIILIDNEYLLDNNLIIDLNDALLTKVNVYDDNNPSEDFINTIQQAMENTRAAASADVFEGSIDGWESIFSKLELDVDDLKKLVDIYEQLEHNGVIIAILAVYHNLDTPQLYDYKVLVKLFITKGRLKKLIFNGSSVGPDFFRNYCNNRIETIQAQLSRGDNSFIGNMQEDFNPGFTGYRYNISATIPGLNTSVIGDNWMMGGPHKDIFITGIGRDILRGKGSNDILQPGQDLSPGDNMVIQDL